MTRFEGTYAGVTNPYSNRRSQFNLEKINLCKAERMLHLLQGRLTVGKSLVWVVLLMSLIAGFARSKAAAATQDPSPSGPVISKIEPTSTHREGTLTVTFNQDVKVSSVQIGTIGASFTTKSSGSIEVTVPKNAPLGTQEVSVTLTDGGTTPLKASITVEGPAISSVYAKAAQPDGKSIAQREGILIITFNQAVQTSSVKIGNVDASVPVKQSTSIEVAVPKNTPLGTQEIVVTLSDGAAGPLKSSVVVVPEVLGLKAHKDAKLELSRVLVAGGETMLQFEGSIPPEIRQNLRVALAPTDGKPGGREEVAFTMRENDYLLFKVPQELDRKTYTVQVWADKTPLERGPRIRVEYVSTMYKWASLVLVGLILLVYLLYKLFYKVPEGQTRYTFVKMLLLEQENQTYSLSRAQFLGWLTVIIWSFLFLYYAHGFVEQNWSYPSVGNAVYAFFISLGTLVAAQATSQGVGVKGAGELHPSPADLVVHGGVLALDRVQQVLWTLIALGMFIRITVSTYQTATALPDIPGELLGLMGLSSVGYLGGKLVRGPGPVIEQVTARAGSVILNIKGRQLSKDGFVWLDGVQQPKEKISFKADDPNSPLKFAKELEVSLDISLADWNAKDHAITFINGDAQRSDWRTGPKIIGVIPGQAGADGKVPVVIKGAHLASGATLEITGAPDAKPAQDEKDPNVFTAKVDPAWLTEPHELIVTSSGQKSTYNYKPPKIIEVIPGQAGADGKVPLVIKGAHLSKGATLELGGAPEVKPVQDDKDPNLFTAKVDPAWLTAPHELIVTSSGQKSSYPYKPA